MGAKRGQEHNEQSDNFDQYTCNVKRETMESELQFQIDVSAHAQHKLGAFSSIAPPPPSDTHNVPPDAPL